MSATRKIDSVKSFFRVVSPDDARARIRTLEKVGTERIDVRRATGRVLAEDLVAQSDLPHFHRSDMDGYAVHAADTFGASNSQPTYLRLTGAVEMGKAVKKKLAHGATMRIPTGGMLPPEADAVVMMEYCDELDDGTVEIQRSVSPWQHVLRRGEDLKQGAPAMGCGRRLRSCEIGALTGLGFSRVCVHRKPKLGLISTGDEIVPPTSKPRPGQVRNINQYSLVAMAVEVGALVTDYGVVSDEPSYLRAAILRALKWNDVVMVSGGSSVGVKDLTTEILLSLPQSEIFFHGISVAPGKPTILGLALGKPVVGLPGHPVSALVIFELFGGPLLRVVGGERSHRVFEPQRVTRARLSQNVASQPGREDYVRVRLIDEQGARIAQPLPGKSGAIFNLVHADGLVRIPASVEGLDGGDEVEVRLF